MDSASGARTKSQRRTYLIDRGFQLKYTLILVVVGAAVSLLFGAMMYQAHVEASQLMDLPDAYRGVVQQSDSKLLYIVLGIAVLMAAALGMFGVLVTHRVSGPIYVFSHYMQVIGQGRYPAIRPLRKNDELKAFFETFQIAVASMKERDRQDGEVLLNAATLLEQAAEKSDKADALKQAAAAVRDLGNRRLEASKSEDPATPGQKAEAAARSAA